MTRLINDPAVFTEQMLEGFTSLYPQYVRLVSGGVVRSTDTAAGKVAVVIGGGSGHYPAFCGTVGAGFADGAVVGNIFTSPSAQDAYNVGKAADNGGGVLFITGNYAGDVLNFNQAQSDLISEGYDVKNFYVTDDVASASIDEKSKRRGIAGDFIVFKIASAAAEKGLNLAEVERVTIHANELTRTLGVGFDGCTLPGAAAPLFTVPKGKMGLGLGIHGEPGISEDNLPSAHDLAKILVEGALRELSENPIKKIAVILNGLGSTKYEELFVTWRTVSALLIDRGYEIVEPEVGELVTSLDMAGCSLSILLLDDELEEFWRAPCDTPAYKKGVTSPKSYLLGEEISKKAPHNSQVITPTAQFNSSATSHSYAKSALKIFKEVSRKISEAEVELGRIDAVAGDGDHGRGMVKGVSSAVMAAEDVVNRDGGLSTLFIEAGKSWAAKAGGTSGVLWGSALTNIGRSLDDQAELISDAEFLTAVSAGILGIKTLGKAELGDKTMLDSMLPFLASLRDEVEGRKSIISAWGAASKVASDSALATAALTPKIGRARPLAEKSVGTADAGATSFALIVNVINSELESFTR
jgi:dihydroxyacetone kinase